MPVSVRRSSVSSSLLCQACSSFLHQELASASSIFYLFLLLFLIMKRLIVTEIHPDQVDNVRTWGHELAKRSSEVLESLGKERVDREFMYVYEREGRWYCLAFVESTEEILTSDQNMEINKKHKEVMKQAGIFGTRVIAEEIYDFIRVAKKG